MILNTHMFIIFLNVYFHDWHNCLVLLKKSKTVFLQHNFKHPFMYRLAEPPGVFYRDKKIRMVLNNLINYLIIFIFVRVYYNSAWLLWRFISQLFYRIWRHFKLSINYSCIYPLITNCSLNYFLLIIKATY